MSQNNSFSKRVSTRQQEYLLQYMTDHPQLAKGLGMGQRSKEANNILWKKLASHLLAQGGGSHKDAYKWRKYWADMKHKTKLRAAQTRRDHQGTGGGPPNQIEDLSETDKKVLDIMGKSAVFGDPQHCVPLFVICALSFYATGSYQKPIGMSHMHSMCQTAVSKCVREVTAALNHIDILSAHIKFPQNIREREEIIQGFYEKFRIPGVLGCIDGTHVAIIRPSEREEEFFNRKHFHSRNVQIICDSNLNILNVDPSFGGAAHDAHIWRLSEINNHMQQLHQRGEQVWLLGDSGYPLRPWLMTPIVDAEPNTPERFYTEIHCTTRSCVERCIGVLKARWRCLLAHRVLHYDHHTAARIINACCVLHNIANRNRLPIPPIAEDDIQRDIVLQENEQVHVAQATEAEMLLQGRVVRNIMVHRLVGERNQE